MEIYSKALSLFNDHIDFVIRSAKQIETLTPIQRFSVGLKSNSESSTEEELLKFREIILGLTDNKIVHTQRGVNDITELFKIFPSLSESYVDLAKTVELLHDTGRFMQGLETGTHVDGDSYNIALHKERKITYDIAQSGITDHGKHGAYLLHDKGLLKQYGIPSDYWEVIYNVVKYHVSAKGLPFSIERLDEKVFSGASLKEVANNIVLRDKFLTLYYQTVKAVDDFDLHNKVLNGEIPILGRKTFGLDVNEGDTVRKIADRWGITPDELRETNRLGKTEELQNGAIVRIDPLLVPAEKFKIANDYATMYYTDTLGTNLPALQNRPDYTFLNAQIFRLSTLRNIEFIPILQNILDNGILDKMFELYPDKYKSIMNPFFTYAKKETNERIAKSKSKIYAPRTVNNE